MSTSSVLGLQSCATTTGLRNVEDRTYSFMYVRQALTKEPYFSPPLSSFLSHSLFFLYYSLFIITLHPRDSSSFKTGTLASHTAWADLEFLTLLPPGMIIGMWCWRLSPGLYVTWHDPYQLSPSPCFFALSSFGECNRLHGNSVFKFCLQKKRFNIAQCFIFTTIHFPSLCINSFCVLSPSRSLTSHDKWSFCS